MKESKTERHRRKLTDAKNLYNFHLEQFNYHAKQMLILSKEIKKYDPETTTSNLHL